jgi:hypothetical protein
MQLAEGRTILAQYSKEIAIAMKAFALLSPVILRRAHYARRRTYATGRELHRSFGLQKPQASG